MKAKDYAQRYQNTPQEDKHLELVRIANDMISETGDLMKKRKVQSNSGLEGVLREIHQKWKAFVKLVPEANIHKDGLKSYLKHKFKEDEDIVAIIERI